MHRVESLFLLFLISVKLIVFDLFAIKVEGQKHQRKARRERREIEKRTAEIEEATRVLSNLTEVEGGKANRFAPKITPQIPSIIAVAVSNQCHPTPSSPESEAKLQSTSSEPPNSAKQEDVIAVTHSAEVAGTSGIDGELNGALNAVNYCFNVLFLTYNFLIYF